MINNGTVSIDMATALELPLGVENEAKFVALRNLHLKKIKQLMASLDVKDREIAKMKILSKDNRRTQMIQALRNKIRDLELINDVVKEELSRKAEQTLEEVNQLIIRKTLGGPKRFRPLTREELENKIFDLEKKLNKKSIDNSGNYNTSQQQQQESEQKFKASADQFSQPKSSTLGRGNTVNDMKGLNDGTTVNRKDENSLLDSYALFDETQYLKASLSTKESTINSLKDEILRLRSRNAELIAAEEEIEFYEKQCEELKEYNNILSKNCEEITNKLAITIESSNKIKNEFSLKSESEKSELLSLRNQCEKLLKQNTTLVKSLSDAEDIISRYEEDHNKKNEKVTSVESSVQSKDQKIKTLEDKLLRAEEKVRQLELKVATLETESSQVPSLKNQLREKNIEIKEIKRNMQEREKVIGLKNSNSRSALRSGSPDPHIVAEEKEKEMYSSPEK
jgi:DNA repair exonuclease SbcCD ATPase subunit